MNYVEKVLGDHERVVYRTHQHIVVLFGRALGSLFAFVVFLAVGLSILVPKGREGDTIRFIVGLIALGSLVMPLYLIVSAWIRGRRGREFIGSIWRAALAGLLILVVALLLMFSPELEAVGWIAVVIAVVPLLETLRIVADWLNEQYIITNRRVMEVKGIINKHVRDSALEKVNDVDLKQSMVGRILGYGTVQIITGSDIGVNRFKRISNPVRFKREMLNAKESLHQAPSAVTREEGALPGLDAAPVAPEPVPPTEASIPDLIVELAELRRQGIISEEEFQSKKKELLNRL